MRDSYERFFSKGYMTKEQFFEFGLKETIYAPIAEAKTAWEKLKDRIANNQKVYIRGFGRKSKHTHLFQDFYSKLLHNDNVSEDPTNNSEPTKIIKSLTGFSKNSSRSANQIRNYQVSHIFGRTKNVYAFTAPWNIVYIPKIIDPFTGHEAKGEMIDEFKALFQQQSYSVFESLVDDFNSIITSRSLLSGIDDYLDRTSEDSTFSAEEISKLKDAIDGEFSPIEIK